jgi:hypothetical protein
MIRNLLSDLYAMFILSFGLAVFIVTLAAGMYLLNASIEIVEKTYKDHIYSSI